VVVAKVQRVFMSSGIFSCLKNGRIEVKCKKLCEMLQKDYDESAMKKKGFSKWYKRFQNDLEDVEDDECSLTQHVNYR
jgi:hypothetical protein